MKQAIIAIEDRRFYTNDGIDVRGIGRALVSGRDRRSRRSRAARRSRSSSSRTPSPRRTTARSSNKLREAALAYQITRKWSKERILRNYLNTIYFGNGAYGIESAARPTSAPTPPLRRARRAPMRAQVLRPEEAALLAGMVASPSGYDPLQHRAAAKRRATSCCSGCSSRATSPAAAAREAARTRCRPAATSSRRPRTRSTRTSPRGSSSRSSTGSVAGRRARGARSRAA